MKDIIKELVDIDEQAKHYSEETEKQKEKYEKEIKKETKKIHDKYMADAEAEVKAQGEKLEKDSFNKFSMDEKKREAAMQKLQKKYDDNADKWVDTIVKDVLN